VEIERLSIELGERCSKGCAFCYNGSHRDGDTSWTADALIELVVDCAAHGVKAFSFGGGEPLEMPELLWPVLAALRGVAFRSLTTNGLPLDPAAIAALADAAIDKVHISIHNPHDAREVARVIAQVHALAAAGVRSGVNLLVRRSSLDAARAVAAELRASHIDNRRIVYLPMRGRDVPSAAEVAAVAAGPFQSTTCLAACGESPRFASISAHRTIARCSYTIARRALAAPSHAAVIAALDGLGLVDCAETAGGLVSAARVARARSDGRTAPA
jgi:sulfatase maturation enzyme AslB (radical SAM superfamily)